MNQNLFYFL